MTPVAGRGYPIHAVVHKFKPWQALFSLWRRDGIAYVVPKLRIPAWLAVNQSRAAVSSTGRA